MHFTSDKVARGLDVGFGFTKISTSSVKSDGSIDVVSIPSYADSHVEALSAPGGVIRSHDLIRVVVDGQPYAVGPDAKKGASGYGKQLLERGFFVSPQYKALCLGAMALMRVDSDIHYLICGLPLNVFSEKSLHDHIKEMLLGSHVVPNIEKGGEKTVTVHQIDIVPQVIGSVLTLSDFVSGSMDEVLSSRNLTIDVGYGTMLWMVSDGLTPIPSRCGSVMGGVSSLLQEVIKGMDSSATTNIGILDRLDQALLSNSGSIRINGKHFDVSAYSGRMDSQIRQNLTAMTRSIGSTSDIDNIFLTGGGAHLYLDAVREAFKGRDDIRTSKTDAQFANVRGFQILAEDCLVGDDE